ncbi:MAG: hypothetical protein ACOC2H_02020 [Spirochaetota bacterium]
MTDGKTTRPLLFRFLTEAQTNTLISGGERINCRPGTLISLGRGDRSFYYIESGSAQISRRSKHAGLIIAAGDGFGHLPYVNAGEPYEVTFLNQGSVIRISDEAIMRLLFTSLKLLRGYCALLESSGVSLVDSFNTVRFRESFVIAVTGNRTSGSSLYGALLSVWLSRNGRVLIVDCSSSGGSIGRFGIQSEAQEDASGPDISGADASDNEKDQDGVFERSCREVDGNLSILDASHSGSGSMEPSLLLSLIIRAAESYTYIVLDCDLALLADSYTPLYDMVFTVENPRIDYELCGSLLDAALEDGQSVVRVANLFHGNRGAERYRSLMPLFEAVSGEDHGSLADGVGFGQYGKMTGPGRKCVYFYPAFYASVAYLSVLKPEENVYYAPGIVSFFLMVYAFFDRDKRSDILTDFFKTERQRLLYKLVYPDESLFSSAYIVSYVKSIFRQLRIEDSPVKMIVPLAASDGRRIHVTTGPAADIAAAGFMIPPYFTAHEVNGTRCYRDSGADPAELYRMGWNSVQTVSTGTGSFEFPFKTDSLIYNILKETDAGFPAADFVIDLPELSGSTIRDYLISSV